MVLMTIKCPQCGAEYAAGGDCGSRFNLCLALEYENPSAYGAVHHLTVICYMLQHNVYSHESWLKAIEMLRGFIQQGVTPADVRKRTRGELDSGRRKWSVTKGARFPKFKDITWTRTVADVRLDSPETYCADVTLWAASILADTEPFIRESKTHNPGEGK
jgi:hypothetical protein